MLKYILVFIFTLFSICSLSASPTRLDGMCLPSWAIQDDWESLTLSPALISRLDGSRILIETTPFWSNSQTSNATTYHGVSNIQSSYLLNQFGLYAKTAYLAMFQEIGFGFVYCPYLDTGYTKYTYTNNYGSAFHEDDYQQLITEPFNFAVLFGMKIGETASWGIKPKFNFAVQTNTMTMKQSGVTNLIYGFGCGYIDFGADAGLNFNFNGCLLGVIAGFSWLPDQIDFLITALSNYFSFYGGVIFEYGAWKGIAKFSSYSAAENSSSPSINYLNKTVYQIIEPEVGISCKIAVSDPVFVVFGANAGYRNMVRVYQNDDDTTSAPASVYDEYVSTNFSSLLYTVCFAGMECEIGDFLIARFGMQFTPVSWISKGQNDYYAFYPNIIMTGPSTNAVHLMDDWKVNCGFTFKPAKNMDFDFLFSITPFINGGWISESYQDLDNNGNGIISYLYSSYITFSLSMTCKI